MATTHKYTYIGSRFSITPNGPQTTFRVRVNNDDGHYDDALDLSVEYSVLNSLGFKFEEALPSSKWDSGLSMDPGVLLGITIENRSPTQFDAILTYGWPNRPLLDGPWVYGLETQSQQIMKNTNVENDPNTVEFRYPGISDADYATDYTQRRYKRIIPVKALLNLDVIRAKCRISRDIAYNDNINVARNPQDFGDYVGAVNDDYTSVRGGTLPRGVILCTSCNVTTMDQGQTYDIEMTFRRDNRGHEDFIFWIDEMGNIPSDITIPPDMKVPYPDDADRIKLPTPYTGVGAGVTHPGGVSRPKMLRLANGINQKEGTRLISVDNFNEHPLNIDLDNYGFLTASPIANGWY